MDYYVVVFRSMMLNVRHFAGLSKNWSPGAPNGRANERTMEMQELSSSASSYVSANPPIRICGHNNGRITFNPLTEWAGSATLACYSTYL
jgi:hypothetical protein